MNKILDVKFGSHLYGTNTENSDLDFKGIYLPTAREIILQSYKPTISTTRPKAEFERNTKNDVDIEIFSLDRFLQLLTQGQTVALDLLFHPEFQSHTITKEIFANKDKLISSNVASFIGYAKQQAAKYGLKGFRVHALRETLELMKKFPSHHTVGDFHYDWQNLAKANEHIKIVYCKAPNNTMEPHLEICDRKLPFHAKISYAVKHVQKRFDEYGRRALMAEQNEGCDWKALSHAVRVNSQAAELLRTGFITFPRPDRQLLLDVKLAKLPYKEVAELIESGLEILKHLQMVSPLRATPDTEWVDDFIYEVYSSIVREAY